MGLLVVDAVALLRQEEPVVAAVLEPHLVERQALERVQRGAAGGAPPLPPAGGAPELAGGAAPAAGQRGGAAGAAVADAVAAVADEVAPLRLRLLRIPAI